MMRERRGEERLNPEGETNVTVVYTYKQKTGPEQQLLLRHRKYPKLRGSIFNESTLINVVKRLRRWDKYSA